MLVPAPDEPIDWALLEDAVQHDEIDSEPVR